MLMQIKKWEELPEFMRNDSVREYYDIVSKKKCSLLFKRVFDIVVSIVLIVILSPVLLIVAIWIKSDSAGPVFFRQKRITQYGREFRIFKFRTMVVDADKVGTLVTTQNDSRITRVGEKIRKSRLDEIPQLFNILLGDMSFVGTRPEVRKYVDEYTDEMMATLLLPAGVTSEASIQYKDEDMILKDAINVDETYVNKVLPDKMFYNLKAIRDFSFFGEIGIMIKTVLAVMR